MENSNVNKLIKLVANEHKHFQPTDDNFPNYINTCLNAWIICP